jgi:hypothetical protein
MNSSNAANDPGNWHAKGTIDNALQADLYRAALTAARSMEFVKGVFWWQWELNNRSSEQKIDYSPQKKAAQDVLKEFWQ